MELGVCVKQPGCQADSLTLILGFVINSPRLKSASVFGCLSVTPGHADRPSASLGGCDVYQTNEFSSQVNAKVASVAALCPGFFLYLWIICLPFAKPPHSEFLWSLDIKETRGWVKHFWIIQTLCSSESLSKKQNNIKKKIKSNKKE